jgi:hypothetical protein
MLLGGPKRRFVANIEQKWTMTQNGEVYIFSSAKQLAVQGTVKEIAHHLFESYLVNTSQPVEWYGEFGPFVLDFDPNTKVMSTWLAFCVIQPELPTEFWIQLNRQVARFFDLIAFV